MADTNQYGDAQYAAEFYALDAEVYAACLALAPQLEGHGAELADLDELCRTLQRPVRDDRERAELMTRLDPENAMRIQRTAVTAWLLAELYAASQHEATESTTAAPKAPAVQAWEEIVQQDGTSIYYYNPLTGETAWALARPFATTLYRHVLGAAEIGLLQAARDADGFLDVASRDHEMVDELRQIFIKCDDDRNGLLDPNEFRDLCVAIAFPLGGSTENPDSFLLETMHDIDQRVDGSRFSGVSWDVLLDFWTTLVPWQKRTRLASPYDQWERLERLDRRAMAPWFRHVTTLRERWQPPHTDQAVVELLTKLFPSTKLEWQQRVEMLWDLQRPATDATSSLAAAGVWTLRECRSLLVEQLGWDHYTRREHVASAVRNLVSQYGGDPDHGETVVLEKPTLVAWMLDCVQRVERDGWDECVDASTGQRYFYHEIRNLTQWDPPHMEDRMATMMGRFGTSGDGSQDDQIQRIFRHYDDDDSGAISFHEFKRLYIALLGRKEAVSGENEADDAAIQQVFSVLDTSGDDAVSLDEFRVWWKTKMKIQDEETEQQRRERLVGERKRIAIEFLQRHDALIIHPTTAKEVHDQEYRFESNILARLVGVLGKYPLKGITYRDALTQLVHATHVVDQEVLLTDFLAWYAVFDEKERVKEEMEAQKARALALLQAQEAETKEKARKLKMIRKGQLITKTIASDQGMIPEPAELVWKRHIQTLFRKFDKDQSGFLDAGELQQLTRALGHTLDATQIQKMVEIMDTSGDQRVSVDEFVTFWTAFQRRHRASKPEMRPDKKQQEVAVDEPHRRQAISMVDATTSMAVEFELAKDRALKLTVGDMKDALGDWKESLLDRARTKQHAKQLAMESVERLEALKKQWAAFVPTTTRRYAHVDVTWIEPEVVACVVDLIETVRRHTRPLPRQDAAQRIQRIMRGVGTRMRLFTTVRERFHTHVDVDTNFYYYVDTETELHGAHSRVWLHRPLFRTITSPMKPWDLVDCHSKVETLRFRHRQCEMLAKQAFFDRIMGTQAPVVEWKQPERAVFVPACFVVYTIVEHVRLRVLGNLWHALRDQCFVLAELIVERHRRQLSVRSNSDAAEPLPLHYVVQHHRTVPFHLLQAIYKGFPDAVREQDGYGRTPLHLALRERAGRRVLALLLSKRRCLMAEPTRASQQPTSVWAMQTVSGETPLHTALRYGISLELLRWLCRHASLATASADVLKTRNHHGHGVFHLVVATLFSEDKAAYWRSVVLVLLHHTWPPRTLCRGRTATGDLPLHLAIERYAAVLHQRAMQETTTSDKDEGSWLWLIRRLMVAFPDALFGRRKHDALLPIHLLIKSSQIPETLVLEVLDATVSVVKQPLDPEELVTTLTLKATQTTLLHYALVHRSHSNVLLHRLLTLIPSASHVQMQPQHELPLHLAARHGASVAIVTRLCEIYGAACQVRNAHRLLPLHLAVQSPTASEDMVRVLLRVCPSEMLSLVDASERHGLRSLVMAANAATPNAGVLRAVLDYTPPQTLTAHAYKRQVTPLFALSLRKCDRAIAECGIPQELESKFEAIEDDDAYFLAMAKARHRKQHHCPTAQWSFEKILALMEKNPIDEAILQRALLALHVKLVQLRDNTGNGMDRHGDDDALGVVVETVTLNREWMLVQRVHQTLYELPWNARIQVLGHKLLATLLPTAFAKAAYKARVDPYFNL